MPHCTMRLIVWLVRTRHTLKLINAGQHSRCVADAAGHSSIFCSLVNTQLIHNVETARVKNAAHGLRVAAASGNHRVTALLELPCACCRRRPLQCSAADLSRPKPFGIDHVDHQLPMPHRQRHQLVYHLLRISHHHQPLQRQREHACIDWPPVTALSVRSRVSGANTPGVSLNK